MPLGRSKRQPDVFPKESFVEGSEELVTTVTLLLPLPGDEPVIGWWVYLEVRARGRFLHHLVKLIPGTPNQNYLWTDQAFIPRRSTTPEV